MILRRVAGLAAATLIAATSVAGLAAPKAAAQSSMPTPSNVCTSNIVIAIPGGVNTLPGLPENLPVGGQTGAAFFSTPGKAVRYVSYNALPFVGAAYVDSRADGIERATSAIARAAADCPGSSLSLLGYSEGADIASRITASIAAGEGPVPAERIHRVALVSDPNNGTGGVRAGTAHPGAVGAFGPLPGGYGELDSRTLSVCDRGDTVCEFPAALAEVVEPLANAAPGAVGSDDISSRLDMLPALPAVLAGTAVHGSYGTLSMHPAVTGWLNS